MTAVLTAHEIHTYYGKSHILHGVSLQVNEGEIVTVLGRNGAGKTTTMRSLMGLTPPRAGKVEIFGHDTTRWPAHRIAQLGVGYVPEGRKIFGSLTVLENLRVPQGRRGPWTLERIFALFPRLDERRAQLGGQLSGGEQEMLAIARPLLINPRIMLLDEPSQGLAPLIVQEVMQVVRKMREEGLSVLLVEQNARLSLSVADRAYVLDDGKVVYDGAAARLAQDTALIDKLAGASGTSRRRAHSPTPVATRQPLNP
ncbi:MAG TPA: ABC transporter ATP-binding protein [Alphaproteobacteria bacterium]|nr:ABC transporter ATP-binding protein [Alphaproteobacteria bacterium]